MPDTHTEPAPPTTAAGVGQAAATSRRTWILVALLLVVSTAIKLALIGPSVELEPIGDQKNYIWAAESINETGVPDYRNKRWDEAHYSPAYPYGLAGVRLVAGPANFLAATRALQSLMSSFSVLFVFLLTRRFFGDRKALWATAIAALHPTPIAYTQYLFTETVYTFLLLGLIVTLLARKDSVGWKRALAAGVIGGALAMTKGQFVTIVPLVCLWFLIQGRANLGRAAGSIAAFIGGLALVIGPWSAHMTSKYGAFMLIDSNAGNVLYKNWNVVEPENHDIGFFKQWNKDYRSYDGEIPLRPRVENDNPAEKASLEVRNAIHFTLEHPGLFARHSWLRAQSYVNPTSFLVRGIRSDHHPWMPGWFGELLIWLTLVSTGGILAFGVLGLLSRRPTVDTLLPLILLAACTGLAVLIVATSRYRFPAMPLLLPFAVDGAFRLPRILRERPVGLWIAAPVLAFMVYAWIRLVPLSL